MCFSFIICSRIVECWVDKLRILCVSDTDILYNVNIFCSVDSIKVFFLLSTKGDDEQIQKRLVLLNLNQSALTSWKTTVLSLGWKWFTDKTEYFCDYKTILLFAEKYITFVKNGLYVFHKSSVFVINVIGFLQKY